MIPFQTVWIPGSSPLARGLRFIHRAVGGHERIIPARAGFTPLHPVGGGAPSDHPRSRGVYIRPYDRLVQAVGSSPLARGLLRPGESGAHGRRIIPARAGFTFLSSRPLMRPPDHPRSRGVYCWPSVSFLCTAGSSPLARGLRCAGVLPLHRRRIIPARAGFTVIHGADILSTRDHPRSRGVYARGFTPAYLAIGSSPLARGLLLLLAHVRIILRIIPARAGFTG